MKKCPQCGRDYTDDSLSFCLDDGAGLLDGPASLDEPLTAILPDSLSTTESPTRTLDPAEAEATKLYGEETRQTAPRKGKLIAGIAGVVVVIVLTFGGYWFYGRGSSKQINSIAVMPFVNESGNADLEYLSDGMTETLINSLSRIPDVSVKSRGAVFPYKGKPYKAAAVAGELNVGSILSGRITEKGDRISLNLELIDPTTDSVLWGNNYTSDSSQLVSLQSKIARDVSVRLKSQLSATSEKEVTKTPTIDPEAYQDYLKGRFYWSKRTRDGLARSVKFFNAAIEKDPGYALAYSGLAQSYVLFPNYGVASSKDSLPKARNAAEKALEIDDSLAEAHAALGLFYINYGWNAEESEAELRRAIELNPDYATAYQWLAIGPLNAEGRFEEAISTGDRATELEPLSLIISTDAGYNRVIAGRYDEAIVKLMATLEIDPDFQVARMALGDAYGHKGNYSRAIEEFRKHLEIEDTSFGQALLARALVKSGDRTQALEIVQKLEQRSAKEYVQPLCLGLLYAALGDFDSAYEMMDKAYDERSRYLVLPFDPVFDDLKKDPRFEKIMKKVKAAKLD